MGEDCPNFASKMCKDLPMYYSKTEEINTMFCNNEYASVFAWMIHIILKNDIQYSLHVS